MPFIFIFGLIAAIAAFFGKQQQQRRNTTWQAAADELGLRCEPGGTFGYPSISGSQGNVRVVVGVARRSGNNNNSVRTQYRVLYPSLDMGLKLQPENFVTKIGRFFGGQDIEVGDAQFDTSYIVKGQDAASIAEFLTPSRRLALLRLSAAFPTVRVDDTGVYLEANGASQSAATIVSIVRRLVSAAHVLVERDENLDESLRTQSMGNLAGALEQLRSRERRPGDMEGPLYEVAALHAAGDDVAAREVLDGLTVVSPEDPEVLGWRNRLTDSLPSARRESAPETAEEETHVASREPDPASGAVPEDQLTGSSPVSPPAWDEDAVRVATELFGSRRMSFETDELFSREYKGRSIRWQGRVSRATTFEYDNDFGEGPGVKAVITIASIENDLYGQTTIDAVVEFPAEAGPALTRDTDVQFTGTLSKVDGMMRNVYVTGGSLVG